MDTVYSITTVPRDEFSGLAASPEVAKGFVDSQDPDYFGNAVEWGEPDGDGAVRGKYKDGPYSHVIVYVTPEEVIGS